jgi:hypothetical protein
MLLTLCHGRSKTPDVVTCRARCRVNQMSERSCASSTRVGAICSRNVSRDDGNFFHTAID